MITKAKVLRTISDNTYEVHIPIYDNGSDIYKATATVSYTRGIKNPIVIGDIVFVTFENNKINKPVIVGKLFIGDDDGKGDLLGDSLEIKKAVRLPNNTIITSKLGEDISLRDYELVRRASLDYLENAISPSILLIYTNNVLTPSSSEKLLGFFNNASRYHRGTALVKEGENYKTYYLQQSSSSREVFRNILDNKNLILDKTGDNIEITY
jgi:hypothetical protein